MNTSKYREVMETKLMLGKEFQTTHNRPLDQYKDLRLCHTCRCVQTMRSTHCRLCGRFVAGFDHHCIYLSSCIGINNRLSFFSLALSMVLVFSYVSARRTPESLYPSDGWMSRASHGWVGLSAPALTDTSMAVL